MSEHKDKQQSTELVSIYRAPDEFSALEVKSLLESDGIPVLLQSRQVPMYDGIFKLAEGYWGDVTVPEEFAERSMELIKAYHGE